MITNFLWFDHEAEEAARFYVSLFPNSRITDVAHYGEAGPREPGTVMTVAFEVDGTPFVALNGGEQPGFKGSGAVSFAIECTTQEEVDRFWNAFSDGGKPGPCGWITDKYGFTWQVVPEALPRLLSDPDREKSQRVMRAMMEMGKIDIAGLEAAAAATE